MTQRETGFTVPAVFFSNQSNGASTRNRQAKFNSPVRMVFFEILQYFCTANRGRLDDTSSILQPSGVRNIGIHLDVPVLQNYVDTSKHWGFKAVKFQISLFPKFKAHSKSTPILSYLEYVYRNKGQQFLIHS